MRKTKMTVLAPVPAGLLLLAALPASASASMEGPAVPARDCGSGELWRAAPRLSGAGGVVRQRFSGRGRPAGGEANLFMIKRESVRREEI